MNVTIKGILSVVIFVIISVLISLSYRGFKEAEDAAIKESYINVLAEHGGAPIITGEKIRSEIFAVDSNLWYHTRQEISSEELKALFYLDRYYSITLQTE